MPQIDSTEMILWGLYNILIDKASEVTKQCVESDEYNDTFRLSGKAKGYAEAANIVIEMHKKVC